MKDISRREFMKLSALSAAVLTGGCQLSPQAKSRPRPNIIFLLTDDQRADSLSISGNKICRTPHIDNLANSGVLFSNMFVTTSICCSSRASVFSGQYMSRHKIAGFETHFSPQAFAQTYPALLRGAGYKIGFIGKYGVGEERHEPTPAALFDYWAGFQGQGEYETIDDNGKPIHLTRKMGNQAEQFLDMAAKGSEPFCLSVSFKAPHCQDGDPRQFIYDQADKDLYADVRIPPVDPKSDADWQKLPKFFTENNEGRTRWDIRFSTDEKYQEMIKGYYRLVKGVDDVVGRIREKLKEKKFDSNTVIIFSSDNGLLLGEHGLSGKWYPYKESIRVPLIIYDPRKEIAGQAKSCDKIALNIDIAPTILDYAGIAVPPVMQGKSLVPLVNNRKTSKRKSFFYEHLLNNRKIPKTEGVVSLDYKYVRFIEQKPVYEQLFDLRKDPREIENLAANPAYSQLLNKMRRQYQELKQQAM